MTRIVVLNWSLSTFSKFSFIFFSSIFSDIILIIRCKTTANLIASPIRAMCYNEIKEQSHTL